MARLSIARGSDMDTFQASVSTAAAARGVAVEHPSTALAMLLKDHQASSIYHSIATARSNATHVGTVELIRAISDTLAQLNDETNRLDSPQAAQTMTENILEALNPRLRHDRRKLVPPRVLIGGRGLTPVRAAVGARTRGPGEFKNSGPPGPL